MAILTLNFESKYLNGNTDINVVMPNMDMKDDPENFYCSGKKYKVMWLLHGGKGDYTDWIRKSNIEVYACMHNLVVVMPSGYNSLYANWDNYAKGIDMPGYFFKELMPLVYGWLPVSTASEDNFIAGMSMGGQGTVKFLLSHPECFGKAAILSTAPRKFPDFYEDKERFNYDTAYRNLVNLHGGLDGFMESSDEPRHVLGEMKESGELKRLPPIYTAIGSEDPNIDNYIDFIAYCRQLGIDIISKIFEGYRHEWLFWDYIIQDVLQFFGFDMRRNMELRNARQL